MMFRFWFALCLTFAAYTAGAATPELSATKTELAQTVVDLSKALERVQKLENELAIHQGTLQIRLDANDKRVADFGSLATMQGTHTTWVGVGITVIVAIAGLMTYLNATARAQSEARAAAQEWFNEKAEYLQKRMDELETNANAASANIETHQNRISDQAQEVEEHFKRAMSAAGTIMQPQSEQLAVNPALANVVRQASDDLDTKPKNSFSAKDHYIRGVALYTNGNLQSALDSLNDAIKISPTPEEHAEYLFAKGVVLEKSGKVDEAIAIYDMIDERYGKSEAPVMREKVVQSLFNKGGLLIELDKSTDAIAVYDAIDERYGKDQSSSVREQVAKALSNKGVCLGKQGNSDEGIATYDMIEERYGNDLAHNVRKQVVTALFNKSIALHDLGKYDEEILVNAKVDEHYGKDPAPSVRAKAVMAQNSLGFSKIMLAKKDWADEAFRIMLLTESMPPLERALAACGPNSRSMIAGNLGYAFFLAGQREEARAASHECLKFGGQKALDAQRADTQVHRIEPADSEYERMLDALWNDEMSTAS